MGVYASRGVWVPKLEGILDRPHATIVNDGKKQSGNFPLTFDESSVNVIKQLSDGIVRVDDRNIAFMTSLAIRYRIILTTLQTLL